MLGGLGGLFKPTGQVKASEVTAHAKEKIHGPFPLQIELEEKVNDRGERVMLAYFVSPTTKGTAAGLSPKELLDDVKILYEQRLQEKSANNAAAREKAAANKVAANKASADALAAKIKEEALKIQKEKDKKHMYEVVQYLTKMGYKYTTDPTFASAINPSDEAKYNELKLSETLIQKYGNQEKKAQSAVPNTRYSSLGSNTPTSAVAVGGKRRTKYRRNRRRNTTMRR